jgi:glycosyltransferase involved in cell wall biosynthesis
MKILFITNYYPPFEIGGYEQLCRDVVERILARGHDVQVLTSDHGVGSQPDNDPPYVYRDLRLHIRYNDRLGIPMQFLWRRPRAAAHNLRCLRASVDRFAPDVVFFWNLQGLPRFIALEAESLSGPGTAYWLAGYSPAEPDEYAIYWSQPALKDARTLHHDMEGRHGAGKVVMRTAVAGTGIIAGGPMRAVFEMLGLQDVVAKSIGTSNPYNMIRATIDGLKQETSPRQVANRRGKKVAEILRKPEAEAVEA